MISTAEVLAHFAGGDGDGFANVQRAQRVLQRVREIEVLDTGPLVLGCLRTFHGARQAHDGPDRDHRALAEVYVWLCELDEVPCVTAEDLAKDFIKGGARDAYQRAAGFYANSLLKLDRWLGNETDIDFGIE